VVPIQRAFLELPRVALRCPHHPHQQRETCMPYSYHQIDSEALYDQDRRNSPFPQLPRVGLSSDEVTAS
jgi:hypothetical protein